MLTKSLESRSFCGRPDTRPESSGRNYRSIHMLASDVNNNEFAGAMDPDAVMIARFYVRAVQNRFKTKLEGRPVFEDKIYCEYYPAGSTLLKMDVPAQAYHKARFAKQW